MSTVIEASKQGSKRTIPPEQRSMGQRIKAARNAAHLTQQQVSIRLGAVLGKDIPRQTYAHYESGLASVESLTLKALAKILGTTVDYLLGNEDLDIPAGVISIFETEPRELHGLYEKELIQFRNNLRQGMKIYPKPETSVPVMPSTAHPEAEESEAFSGLDLRLFEQVMGPINQISAQQRDSIVTSSVWEIPEDE